MDICKGYGILTSKDESSVYREKHETVVTVLTTSLLEGNNRTIDETLEKLRVH